MRAKVIETIGTNDVVDINGIFTRIGQVNYSFRGTVYGFYANSNPMTLKEIQAVENWMTKRYSI